jgi:diadenosine tetraphosphate (Ap4A) HIT family hydrolase
MLSALVPLLAVCPFCNPDVIERQSVAETDKFHVLYCLTPATDGNLLIVPKRHMTRFEELEPDEAAELFKVIQKTQDVFKKYFGLSDYLLVQKNGKNAGQSVDHIHVHAMPCPEKMDLTRVFLYRPPITREEMKEAVQDLAPAFR